MTTIADLIAERNRVWINCGVCNGSKEIDLGRGSVRITASCTTNYAEVHLQALRRIAENAAAISS